MKKLFFLFTFLLSSLFAEGDLRLLNSYGKGSVKITATLADLRLGVEVEGKTADVVEEALSSKVNQVVQGLKKLQYEPLTTSSFQVFPEYGKQRPNEIEGYRGRAEILLTVKNEEAGRAIASAIASGANKVNGIELKADDTAITTARHAALKIACEEAVGNAKVALDALGVAMVEIMEVDLQPSQFHPVPYRAGASFAKMDNSVAIEGEMDVNAEISLKIRIK